ncbi:peptidoglycan-binding protein LysM [Novimethylophilus kurashikiensis]|uniref:Peptidoglycan-binding protein LysM n=1 Tax=Novimethylophilus kurashikiensis TaxID=1825523 RepID=A0A2R5F6W6_9PROT|nr:LysM peptidoglycan-binding domain-containing protein [Novimethylophilus kurashikiensis]GBG13805.1 peptidoglycan-binding protein LysM [Novimethylophilus kurashikiensis]
MKKRIITLLMLCGIATPSLADELKLQPNHPDRYVVVKGDTLWGISGKFLKDPWRWPQIWKMNRAQIKNPHWIYPGDVVVLDTSSGHPELRLLRQTVQLEPNVIVEPLDQAAVPPISPSVIAPFLSQPLIVEEQQLHDAPEIIGAPEGRLVLSSGYRAYVSNIKDGDQQTWQIYRPGEKLVDPDTKESLGYEAIYLGDAKVVRFGEPATVTITRSKQDINAGDKLVPASDTQISSYVPHAPDSEVKGRILTSYSGASEIGRDNIVTINRGSSDGLEEGHVLAVFSDGEVIAREKTKQEQDPRDHIPQVNLDIKRGEDGKLIVNRRKDDADEPDTIKLPDERAGLVMVFRTFEHVSYALVMQSERPMHVNDWVQNP